MPFDWLFRNPLADRLAPYCADQRAVLSLQGLHQVQTAMAECPMHRPTPLHGLPGLAAELGLRAVLLKDESHRFGFGAFKALGGVYALARQLQKIVSARLGVPVSFADLAAHRHADIVAQVTVAAASSGNHGRSVAAGARLFGCRCTIFLPSFTSPEKENLIRQRGAEVIRIAGDYDRSLEECRRIAAARGWLVVSDMSWEGYVEIPRDVMQAYGVIADEALHQLAPVAGVALPTHVLAQAGVGGLAAAIAGTFREACGADRPSMVVVEPESADCFLQSARAGKPTPASGDAVTAMGGLACREISPDAWTILRTSADWFCTVRERDIAAAMSRLAAPAGGDRPLALGPSGVAGLMGLLRITGDPAARRAVGLDRNAVVLLIGSEGAAGDPLYFCDAVGRDAATISAAGQRWDGGA